MIGEATREQTTACRLSFTWLGVTRTAGREAIAETAMHMDADRSRLSVSKRLIDTRHPAFRRLTLLRASARGTWLARTLPYVEDGVRLIARERIDILDDEIRGIAERIEHAAIDLNLARADLIDDARRRLGRLYRESDYPGTFVGLFGCSIDFPSVEPPSYLERLHPDVYRRERDRIAAQFAAAAAAAEQAFAGELADMLTHLRERLAGRNDDGRAHVFRDSAIANVREFFSRFRLLSIESSGELASVVDQAERLLDGVEPDALRTSDDLRAHVARELGAIETDLAGMTVARPARRIVRLAAEGATA